MRPYTKAFLWAPALFLLAPAQQQPTPASTLNRYCLACHNNKVKTSGLSFESTSFDTLAAHPETWEKVVKKLRTFSMPPAGLPRPDERTYASLSAAIESAIDKGKPNPGRTDTFRRLNRTEYRNAIRDLLALDVDVDALLPSDES
ncbi:MAG: DUF1587 domain-containing protein, partial [Candidatus Solibacter usitatus]|nr:DUF1587 domain-containing protein [Candidatus Solibacter usitatus]